MLKLAFTAYLLSLAIFIPISGWCADRFGARTVFRSAIAIFTVASLACGFAQSLEALVIARAFQGLGGALMVPVGRIIMLRLVPKAELLGAMALLTMPALVGPLVGPPVGGFITTYFHWRWIFWINIPFGILGIVLASRYMPRLVSVSVPKLDLTGFLLVRPRAWRRRSSASPPLSRSIMPPLMAPAADGERNRSLGYLCRPCPAHSECHPRSQAFGGRDVPFERSRRQPLPHRSRSNPFLLPLLLQVGFGLNAFQTGLLMFASAIGAMSMKMVAARVLRRFGFRRVLIVNVLIGSALLGANALLTEHTPIGRSSACFSPAVSSARCNSPA